MNQLNEVSQLFAQRAGDIEKSREIFTAETRSFVSSILSSAQMVRAEPWTAGRVRLDLPREIDRELKAGYLTSQFALARVDLRFKKGMNFLRVAQISFGIEFDFEVDAFIWTIMLVPEARYQRLDDALWRQARIAAVALPGASHLERANTVRFVQRSVDSNLTTESAYGDVKTILEFIISSDQAIAEAVGLELAPREDGA